MLKNKFKFPKTFLTLLLLTAYSIPLTATIRYVSHEGSNTPPYTTWETAADSIMSAINISMFGDTIYVANGVYEEQVTMIPGLTLIGAGMDSCVIDTRGLVQPTDFSAVELNDKCSFTGFRIVVSDSNIGSGIKATNGSGLIYKNEINNSFAGVIYFDSGSSCYLNTIKNVHTGIWISNLLPNVQPLIADNLIITSQPAGIGIKITFVDSIIIKNNIIYLTDDFAKGYSGSLSDTVKIYNNLIISESANNTFGFDNSGVPTILFNNYVSRNLDEGIVIRDGNMAQNNTVIGANIGFHTGQSQFILKYNNSWENETDYLGTTPDSTNLSVDPMIVSEDSLDFHLQKFSPLIDAGDPNIIDIDGSRSDIGLYGGPFGERYKYLDLAPKPPRNLSAEFDSINIEIKWNQNTEADFKSYNLFRDTTANFTLDSTSFVTELTDTFYQHIIPPKIDAFYYKLTATDNQGNESQPSEELDVIITSINEHPTAVSNYQLYQNYPNPFNPSTKIAYKLKERGYVKLYVYDIKGELVSVLVNQTQDAGYYEVEFNAGVGPGLRPVLASGIYIY
jgi:hypothetical protein